MSEQENIGNTLQHCRTNSHEADVERSEAIYLFEVLGLAVMVYELVDGGGVASGIGV